MKRKKQNQKFTKLFLAIPVGLTVLGFVLFELNDYRYKDREPEVLAISSPTEKPKKTIYPKQYSDIKTTKSAKETDPRFKDIVLVDKASLLANVISLVVKNNYVPKDTGPENGTWLWTPTLSITPEYRKSIISGSKKNGIKSIYLSIDSYLDIFVMEDGEEKENKKKAFDKIVSDFIIEAEKNSISVDAEAGWQNWAEAGNRYKAYAVLDYIINFNKTHKEKFRGFQYDVEVYLLPSYQENKHITLYNFANLIDETVVKLDGTDLQFAVVIPDFYDRFSTETPQFSYRGEMGFIYDHLLTVLERRRGSQIIVMSYRNFTKGTDSSIDISIGEVTIADTTNTKVVIAQETGDVPPPYITFFNTNRSYYDKQLAAISSAFANNRSFGGVATHYINAFLELK